jgi:transposase
MTSRPQGRPTREAAGRLFARGVGRADVARQLGISRATATRWFRLWAESGLVGLVERERRGRRPRLSTSQLSTLRTSLLESPSVYGLPTGSWSLAAVAAHLRATTGATFHVRHVPRLLRRAGWVVSPVGPFSGHAFCQEAHADPDGNQLFLRYARTAADS